MQKNIYGSALIHLPGISLPFAFLSGIGATWLHGLPLYRYLFSAYVFYSGVKALQPIDLVGFVCAVDWPIASGMLFHILETPAAL